MHEICIFLLEAPKLAPELICDLLQLGNIMRNKGPQNTTDCQDIIAGYSSIVRRNHDASTGNYQNFID